MEYINSRIVYYKTSQIKKIIPEDLPVGVMATIIKSDQKKVNNYYLEKR
jgi:hypothetical protein